jgi:predicted unusual protein kinase regulating ubiquinone biosynthesis (AarF/ABC1/UbiB family)
VVYLKSFGENFDDSYEIEEVLSSGSMGGTYKIKSKWDQREYCMKVVHPNINYEINILNYLFKIPIIQKLFHKIIPISLVSFFDKFKDQVDMVKESNNILKFKELYRENVLLHIPEVYKVSSKVLIMEYIQSQKLENCDNLSQFKKEKLISYLYLFVRNNNLYNFNHGDIHKGNWGVSLDQKRIVIYDMGLCWSINREKHQYLLKLTDLFNTNYASDDKIFLKLATIFSGLLSSEIDNDEFVKHAHGELSNNKLSKVDFNSIYYILICHFIHKGLTIDYNAFCGLIVVFQTHKLFEEYNCLAEKKFDEWIHTTVKQLYDISEAYNIFPYFRDYYKKDIQSIEHNTEIYDIIRDKLKVNY